MDIINGLLIIVALVNLLLSTFMYFNKTSKNEFSSVFSLLAFSVFLWSIAMVFYRQASIEYSILAMKTLYTMSLPIPVIFLYFTKIYSGVGKNFNKLIFKGELASFLVLFALGVLGTNLFVSDVTVPQVGEKIVTFGSAYVLYILYFLVFFGLSFILLSKKFFSDKTVDEKNKTKFLLIGTFIASLIGMITNLLLPWFGIGVFNWVGNISTVFFVFFVLYATLKYGLFNLKVIATEVLSVFIIITLLVDLLFSTTSFEVLIKTFVLFAITFSSYLLIRSVYDEVETRKQVEVLADDLKEANVRLRDLDEQKSEFVSIASHQLRTPLTSIKGYSSLLLDGSFGKLTKEIENPIGKIFESSQRLVGIVEDFLNVTRIEQGRMKYSFTAINMSELMKSVVDELTFAAKQKKLTIEFTTDKQTDYLVNIDMLKMRQVIFNLVDNAVKYTSEGGIKAHVSKDIKRKKIIASVTDTGMGISESFRDNLFKKFSRSEKSNDFHANGSGIGLYIAREIIKGHNGRIWAESKGDGKGSVFYIELPMSI